MNTVTPMAKYYVVARSPVSRDIYGIEVLGKRGLSHEEAVDLAISEMGDAMASFDRPALAGITHGEVLDATGVYFMSEVVFDYPVEDLI